MFGCFYQQGMQMSDDVSSGPGVGAWKANISYATEMSARNGFCPKEDEPVGQIRWRHFRYGRMSDVRPFLQVGAAKDCCYIKQC